MLQIFDYAGAYRRDVGKDCDQTWWSFTRDPKPKEKQKHIPSNHDFIKYLDQLENGNLSSKILYRYTLSFDSSKSSELSIIDTVDVVKNGKKYTTTLGRYIFNKVIFHKLWNNKHFPFYDIVMFKDKLEDIFKDIRQLVIEKKAESDDLFEAISLATEFGLRYSTLYNAGLTVSMMLPDAKFDEFRKKELDKVRQKVIETGDIALLQEAEQKIIAFAKDYYKDDDMMEMFQSKVKASFDNEFKNLNITMGALPTLDGRPTFVFDSLADGISPKYLPELVQTGAGGALARGLFTAKAGALFKDIVNSLQSIKGIKGDCGTTKGKKINTSDKQDLLNRYVISGGKSVLITSENVDKYLNKDIVIRTPMHCKMKNGHFCSHCIGELPFMLTGRDEITLGMMTADAATGILNMFMKATHALGADVFIIDDLNKFLVPKISKPIFENRFDPIEKIERVYCLEDIEWRLPSSSVTAIDTYYSVLAHGSIISSTGHSDHAFVLGTEVYTNPTEIVYPNEEVDNELEKHVVFKYYKGDVFLTHTHTDRKEMTVYKMFNLFLSGNASSLVPFETHLTTMKNTLKSNKKAKISDMSLEIILSALARNPDNVEIPAREKGIENYKFVSMYDLIVLGGMFNSCFSGDAVKSIFINMNKSESEQIRAVSPMEKALRY